MAFQFWILSSFGIIPVLMFDGFLALVYLLGVVLIQMIYAMTCKQDVADTLRYFPANMLFMLRVMIQALRVKRKGSYLWKGRDIYS